ncbi:unnamed protein product [Spirodela intermedia]|uniref:Uncharacterized protein n=1 Tax=Spirodela intermedia TaxID=51605 RepID=A0A7I8K7G7_SPIIN|nr:unnamed protein product [Spirodela intermedia]
MRQILPPRLPVVAAGNGSNSGNGTGGTSASLFASLLASAAARTTQSTSFSDLMGAAMSRNDNGVAPQLSSAGPSSSAEPISLRLSHSGGSSLFSGPLDRRPLAPPPPTPHMSATALLQKAAQMGATASNSSLLRSFGLVPSSSSASQQHPHDNPRESYQSWRGQQHHLPEEPAGLSPALGLGLPYGGGGGGMPSFMVGPPPFFVAKPTTLDFLGLGRGPGGGAAGGLSALITSIGGSLERATDRSEAWDGADRPPGGSALL